VTRREKRCSGRRRKGIVATLLFSEVGGKQEGVGEDEGDDSKRDDNQTTKGQQTTASRSGIYSRKPSMLAMRDSERGARRAGDGF
jgi:hypothetical protein